MIPEQVSEQANELSLKEGVTWQTMLGRATFVIKKDWHTYNQVAKHAKTGLVNWMWYAL